MMWSQRAIIKRGVVVFVTLTTVLGVTAIGGSVSSASAHVNAKDVLIAAERKVAVIKQSLPTGLLEQSRPAGTSVQQGADFTGWATDAFSGAKADNSLQALAAAGAKWVSINLVQFQTSTSSTSIFPTSGTVSAASLTSIIKRAHALGLNVSLKPMVDTLSGVWRGEIGQTFTPAQWTAWFKSYDKFMLRYAELAQSLGVQQLVVGTELQEASSHASNWVSLVNAIRVKFKGSLTYGANWNYEAENITWWNHLNYIGVDAYYPLDPTQPDYGWQEYLTQLSALSESFNNEPILFTEIGYMSTAGTLSDPGNYALAGTGPVDLTEQADAYQATFEAIQSEPWLAGIYWWSWSPSNIDGATDGGYSPQNKPAEQVLTSWYGGSNS
jgi:hypothetical protein